MSEFTFEIILEEWVRATTKDSILYLFSLKSLCEYVMLVLKNIAEYTQVF